MGVMGRSRSRATSPASSAVGSGFGAGGGSDSESFGVGGASDNEEDSGGVEVFSTVPISRMLVRDDAAFARRLLESPAAIRALRITDQWRNDWNAPVQVPARRPLPQPHVGVVASSSSGPARQSLPVRTPKLPKLSTTPSASNTAAAVGPSSAWPEYDADDEDLAFLATLPPTALSPVSSSVSTSARHKSPTPNTISLDQFERTMDLLERYVHQPAHGGAIHRKYGFLFGHDPQDANALDMDVDLSQADTVDVLAPLQSQLESRPESHGPRYPRRSLGKESSDAADLSLLTDDQSVARPWLISQSVLEQIAKRVKLPLDIVIRIGQHWRLKHEHGARVLLRSTYEPTLLDRLRWYGVDNKAICKRLRVSLEKLRLVCDLVLKRERLKASLLRLHETVVNHCVKDFKQKGRQPDYESPYCQYDAEIVSPVFFGQESLLQEPEEAAVAEFTDWNSMTVDAEPEPAATPKAQAKVKRAASFASSISSSDHDQDEDDVFRPSGSAKSKMKSGNGEKRKYNVKSSAKKTPSDEKRKTPKKSGPTNPELPVWDPVTGEIVMRRKKGRPLKVRVPIVNEDGTIVMPPLPKKRSATVAALNLPARTPSKRARLNPLFGASTASSADVDAVLAASPPALEEVEPQDPASLLPQTPPKKLYGAAALSAAKRATSSTVVGPDADLAHVPNKKPTKPAKSPKKPRSKSTHSMTSDSEDEVSKRFAKGRRKLAAEAVGLVDYSQTTLRPRTDVSFVDFVDDEEVDLDPLFASPPMDLPVEDVHRAHHVRVRQSLSSTSIPDDLTDLSLGKRKLGGAAAASVAKRNARLAAEVADTHIEAEKKSSNKRKSVEARLPSPPASKRSGARQSLSASSVSSFPAITVPPLSRIVLDQSESENEIDVGTEDVVPVSISKRRSAVSAAPASVPTRRSAGRSSDPASPPIHDEFAPISPPSLGHGGRKSRTSHDDDLDLLDDITPPTKKGLTAKPSSRPAAAAGPAHVSPKNKSLTVEAPTIETPQKKLFGAAAVSAAKRQAREAALRQSSL